MKQIDRWVYCFMCLACFPLFEGDTLKTTKEGIHEICLCYVCRKNIRKYWDFIMESLEETQEADSAP